MHHQSPVSPQHLPTSFCLHFKLFKMLLIIHFLACIALVAARTNLDGCISSAVIAYGGASLLWYVPGSGEICNFLDCGGGRAPNKKDIAGCPGYTGTGTYSPSFLTGFTIGPPSTAAISTPVTNVVAVTSNTSTGTPSSSQTANGELTMLTGAVQTTGNTLSNSRPTSTSPSSIGTTTRAAIAGTSISSGVSSSPTGNSGSKFVPGGNIMGGALALAVGAFL